MDYDKESLTTRRPFDKLKTIDWRIAVNKNGTRKFGAINSQWPSIDVYDENLSVASVNLVDVSR